MSQPFTTIGKPLDRVDGPLKVGGQATYAAEYRPQTPALTGWIVEATIGKGRIIDLDTTRAEQAPGVRWVLTHRNAPPQAPFGSPEDAPMRFAQSHALMDTDQIRHHGYPLALVVADSLEQARHAATLIEVEYQEQEGIFKFDGYLEQAFAPPSLDGGLETDVSKGDFDPVYSGAPVQLDLTYTTAGQHPSPMEPHATVAEWQGDRLTLHGSLQMIAMAKLGIANTLKMDPDKVRVVSPFIGGGFGSKLGIQNEAVLAAIAARELGRAVKIAQSRRNMFANVSHRGPSRQRLRLGATEEGRILAVAHESWMPMARDYQFAEGAASPTRSSYGCEAMLTTHRVVAVDMPRLDSMRAPGEAIGSLVLESAMDELADRLGIDPLELRLRNEPEAEPASGRPFASRDLARCLKEGAERFGWSNRPKTASRRQGDWLIGYGLASAVRPNLLMPSQAQIHLTPEGRAIARLDMTDIGTGSYTILTQIAAEALGLPVERVKVELGDSDFAKTAGSGGSFGAASSGSALYQACLNLREAVIKLATEHPESPLKGAKADQVQLADGQLTHGDRSVPLAQIVALPGGEGMTAEGEIQPGEEHEKYAQFSYGAHFVEVAVDRHTGEVRLRRMLGVFSAGRLLNAKTARSQCLGGMVFGIGGALTEELMLDDRYGAFMNRDLAEYHLPVNRDVPDMEVVFLEQPDTKSNPLGSKGLGELGICGAGAAIANAVYNATGVRVRDFPLTLDKVLAGLPD